MTAAKFAPVIFGMPKESRMIVIELSAYYRTVVCGSSVSCRSITRKQIARAMPTCQRMKDLQANIKLSPSSKGEIKTCCLFEVFIRSIASYLSILDGTWKCFIFPMTLSWLFVLHAVGSSNLAEMYRMCSLRYPFINWSLKICHQPAQEINRWFLMNRLNMMKALGWISPYNSLDDFRSAMMLR